MEWSGVPLHSILVVVGLAPRNLNDGLLELAEACFPMIRKAQCSPGLLNLHFTPEHNLKGK